MADLVERLRHEASLRAHYGDPILEEAADEIKSLRKELAQTKEALYAEQEASISAGSECSALRLQVRDMQQHITDARRYALEEAAKVCEERFPRGGAHTYASENADRYIALEDAAEACATAILRLRKTAE
jgi:L-lactate utilization protein LutB